jgi:DNA polymerase V
MTKKFKTNKDSAEFAILSPEEALAWLDGNGIKYEICDTPIPIMGNKASCGTPKDIGDEMIEDYYYLPKSVVGLHPLVDIPAQGDSMIDADIYDGDLLQLEIGATACDGEIVLAEIDHEYTAKVFFTDDQKRHWLCPKNRRYRAILLKEEMNVRIAGVVRNIVKKAVRQSYSECMAIVRQTLESRRQEGDMFECLAKAVREGGHLFWAASAWAVAYSVVRDCCGYEGSVSDFERRAIDMSLPEDFDYGCSVGKVQRTISNHPYMRLHIDRWKENGASAREVVLMVYLKENI